MSLTQDHLLLLNEIELLLETQKLASHKRTQWLFHGKHIDLQEYLAIEKEGLRQTEDLKKLIRKQRSSR
jgi:hypothetical protein